jgi:hypothetical protein
MRAIRPIIVGSIASGVMAAAAARNRSRERAIRTFYDRAAPEPTIRELSDMQIRLPLVMHRAEGIYALFPADLEKVRGQLSSPALHPVQTLDGRATFAIGAFRYHDGTFQMADGSMAIMEPYGEVMIGPLVTSRPAPPMLEAYGVLGRFFGLGVDVMHLPVTTRQARDGGIGLWGLPKFVADMEFEDSLVERVVHLSEGGEPILELAVAGGGREILLQQPMITYSVLDGELLQVPMPGIRRGSRRIGDTGARLQLGSHPIAEAMRRLEIDVRPIASVTEIESRFFMGSGRPIGPGVPRTRFAGADRDHGRYVVRHPGTEWIDQYGARVPTPAAEPSRQAPTVARDEVGASTEPAPVD